MKENQIVYIPVNLLYPHPDNPRKELGDLTELADSIAQNGVMQNLTVVKNINDTVSYQRMLDGQTEGPVKYSEAYRAHAIEHCFKGDYTVVIGHRRHAAAKLAGLEVLPCVIADMDYPTQIATMMTENLQRVDLTVYEQAQGFKQLSIDCGMSAKQIAERTGFSAATVRRRLKLAELDQEILREVSSRQISMQDLERLDKIENEKLRNEALRAIGTANFESRIAAAEQDQKKKARVAEWRRICLDAGLSELSEGVGGNRRAYTMVAGIYDYTPTVAAIKKKLDEKSDVTEILFYVDRWGYVYLVTPRGDASDTEIDTEKRDREIKARTDACNALKEAFERAHKLRESFIRNYSEAEAKKNMSQILRLGLEANLSYSNRFGFGPIAFFAGFSDEELEEMDGWPEWFQYTEKGIEKNPFRSILWFVYSASGDCDERRCFNLTSWSVDRGEYDQNADYGYLDTLYANLRRLGYEMSDEEIALMDGSSELYYRGEAKE